ncbi:hypothetical protein RZS08_12855, partial [Arthrospira platensis SPKY1]|nr:hypothetical protein [Arthrospira platensis SPKY1]
MLGILLLLGLLQVPPLWGQSDIPFDPRTCGYACSSNDISVLGAQLYVDVNATTPLMPGCNPGDNVLAYLCVTFQNTTNSTRKVVAIAADVYADNVLVDLLAYCPNLIIDGSATETFCVPTPITWVCGQTLELRD